MSGSSGAASNCPAALAHLTREVGELDSSAVAGFHRWPLVSSLEFGPLPNAVPCARLQTRHVLKDWDLGQITEDAEIIVSELMTNAIVATRAAKSYAPVRLWVLSDGSRTVIMVGDSSPHPPRRADPDEDTEDGRGLLIVESLSSNWGWNSTGQRRITKVVWAELHGSTQSE